VAKKEEVNALPVSGELDNERPMSAFVMVSPTGKRSEAHRPGASRSRARVCYASPPASRTLELRVSGETATPAYMRLKPRLRFMELLALLHCMAVFGSVKR
jgi:hypothetical protein